MIIKTLNLITPTKVDIIQTEMIEEISPWFNLISQVIALNTKAVNTHSIESQTIHNLKYTEKVGRNLRVELRIQGLTQINGLTFSRLGKIKMNSPICHSKNNEKYFSSYFILRSAGEYRVQIKRGASLISSVIVSYKLYIRG
jgi:hypothetical protein